LRFLLQALTRTPLPVLYAWGWVLHVIVFHIVRWRRDQVASDIALAFPDKPAAERARILRQSYRNIADVVMEAIWGFGASAERLAQRVTFENTSLVDAAVAARQSVVLLTPHFCNWEWLLPAGGARFGLPIDAVYQKQRVATLDRFLLDARSRFGGKPILREDFVYELMNRAGTPRGYALIADQTPPRDDKKHWSRFLNRDTAFFVGAEKVARFLDSPVLTSRCAADRDAIRCGSCRWPCHPSTKKPGSPRLRSWNGSRGSSRSRSRKVPRIGCGCRSGGSIPSRSSRRRKDAAGGQSRSCVRTARVRPANLRSRRRSPDRDRREPRCRDIGEVQRPVAGQVGGGPGAKAWRIRKVDVELPKGRDEAVARRLAHRFLARPIAQKPLPSEILWQVRKRCLFPWREELPCEPVGADLAVAVLDIDADARLPGEIAGNRHQRDAAGVRDVEIDARRDVGELGTTAHARRSATSAASMPRVRPSTTRSAPPRHPALAERSGAEARGARQLGRKGAATPVNPRPCARARTTRR
jgi:KDO2-lipid IV(A) lauroyltransferase